MRTTIGNDIGRYAYRELRAFCLQYPEKLHKANSYLGTRSPSFDAAIRAGVSSPVERAADKREKWLRDIALIDRCARAVDNGRWFAAIIRNCCYGQSVETIDPIHLPSCNRNEYFRARRMFFRLLWEERNKI